jgi:hypothetical protein
MKVMEPEQMASRFAGVTNSEGVLQELAALGVSGPVREREAAVEGIDPVPGRRKDAPCTRVISRPSACAPSAI